MDHQDFSNTLNNMKDLTLRQIFKIIINLKYKTIAMIVFMISSVLSGAFVAGKFSQQKETAVMLESPFAMRLELNNEKFDFESLTLNKDPTMISPSQDKMVLSLREIKSSFDIIPVGKVIAQVENSRISIFWRLLVSRLYVVDHAHAKDIDGFNWNGHEEDFKFKEQFVSKDIVHRYYSDECILEYSVDSDRKSIPESFIWVKIVH